MSRVNYNNIKFRFFAALGASTYILFHARPLEIIRALSSPFFYLAFLVSFAIAQLLVFIIHRVTLWLDVKMDWRTEPILRGVLQFTLCVLLPLLIDLLLISVYFEKIGQDITKNGFLTIDLPVIFGFLVLLSFYYYNHYHRLTERPLDDGGENPEKANQSSAQEKNLYDKKAEKIAGSHIIINHKGTQLILSPAGDIFYFYRVDRLVHAMTFYGTDFPVPYSLKQIVFMYGKDGFCQTKREVAINCRSVLSYKNGIKRNTLQIMPKQEYQEIPLPENETLIVTKNYIPEFIRMVKQFSQ